MPPGPFVVHRPHPCSGACQRFTREADEKRRLKELNQQAGGGQTNETFSAERQPVSGFAIGDLSHRWCAARRSSSKAWLPQDVCEAQRCISAHPHTSSTFGGRARR